jgi:hypothetical protein
MDMNLNVSDDYLYESLDKYVQLQQGLIAATLYETKEVSDHDLRTTLPGRVEYDGREWLVRPHGAGAAFTSGKVTLDIHKGMLSTPGAFDAWRLHLHWARRRLLRDIGMAALQQRLERLAQLGFIEIEEQFANHFRLKKSNLG